MKKFGLGFLAVFLLVLSVFVFAGCSSETLGGSKDINNPDTQPTSSIDNQSDQSSMIDGKLPVIIYFADKDTKKLKKEIRYVMKSEAAKSVNNIAAAIVNELLQGPDPKSGVGRVITKEVKLIGDVKIDITGAKCTINFSKEFSECVVGGKEMEALAIKSIVNSLTELKEVQMVQILVEGKLNGIMKGGTKLDELFKRDTTVITVDGELTPKVVG